MPKEQPVYIMPDGSNRSTGRTAQRNNILAARLVGETIRTTLGPKGMDKLLIDAMGDITVTNDGVTILREMQIEHPIAKMMVEIAKTQEREVGDGTTTVVIFAAELLKKAEELLDQDIHPSVIISGYRKGAEKALALLNTIAAPMTKEDERAIAMTAMTGKSAEADKELLARLVTEGVNTVKELRGKETFIDTQHIKIETKSGGSVQDTTLIQGIVLDKEKLHPDMPRRIEQAKIALFDMPIEIRSTEIDAKIQITNPAQMQEFLDMEESMLRSMVKKIVASGANVVFCQKGIDDLAQHFLAKSGVYACRRVKKSDMERLSKATGAKIITTLDDLAAKDIGQAGVVEQRRFGDEEMTYVYECPHAKAVSILVKGATEQMVAEIKRALEDAIGVVAAAARKGSIVGGAAAIEMELAQGISKYAQTLSGREQLAVRAFADSFLIVPRTLAENAGLDPIDVLTALRASHEQQKPWSGIDVHTGNVMDTRAERIIEPVQVKTQAISAATEVAIMILRIDDVIASARETPAGSMPDLS